MQTFNREEALELLGGDQELLKILIDSFLNENKFEEAELQRLIQKDDLSQAASYVHATKGAARQLCLENLKETGQALEDRLRGKSDGDLELLCHQMLKDYQEAIKVLSDD